MTKKFSEQETLKELKKTNKILSNISKKESLIIALEKEENQFVRGKWAWCRRNLSTIVSIVSPIITILALFIAIETLEYEFTSSKLE